MAGHNQAPKLVHQGAKQRSDRYWSYDPDLLEFIMNETKTASGQLKLMLYLMGNKPGVWSCSEADVLRRTGISNAGNLSKVKKALRERGWITYEEGKHITVLFDNMYEQMRQGCSENNSDKIKSEGCSENKSQGCSQNSEGCSENNAEGCSENNHNNIQNNIYNNNTNNKPDFSSSRGEELAEEGSKPSPEAQTTSSPADLPLFYLLFPGVGLKDLISMGKARQVEDNIYEVTKVDGSKILVRER